MRVLIIVAPRFDLLCPEVRGVMVSVDVCTARAVAIALFGLVVVRVARALCAVFDLCMRGCALSRYASSVFGRALAVAVAAAALVLVLGTALSGEPCELLNVSTRCALIGRKPVFLRARLTAFRAGFLTLGVAEQSRRCHLLHDRGVRSFICTRCPLLTAARRCPSWFGCNVIALHPNRYRPHKTARSRTPNERPQANAASTVCISTSQLLLATANARDARDRL